MEVTRYEIAIATADYLEQHPEKYDFFRGIVPKENRVGCVLGHMGRLAGVPAHTHVKEVARNVLGMHEYQFYNSLWRAQGVKCPQIPEHCDASTWIRSAKAAAECLRKVADKEFKGNSTAVAGWHEKKAQEVRFWDEYNHFMTDIQLREILYREYYSGLDVI
jgi:hypothetical protein